MALGFPGASSAYCFSAEQVRAQPPEHWARYVLRHADVVMEAEVVRRMGGEPEVLRMVEIYKGLRRSVFTLGLPDEN